MFSNSLIFTTLVATLYAVSVNAGDLTAKDTVNPIQCQDVPLSWTGGKGPYNVYVFTACSDDSDDPIATFNNVDGHNVTWSPTLTTGDGFFFQVEDADGATDFSDEDYFGGDQSKADECKKQIAASESAASVAATATPTASNSAASGGVPTTMSKSTSTTAGASGVDNAASDPTGAVGNKAGSDAVANGASSLVARPFEIAAGLLAAGAVAFL